MIIPFKTFFIFFVLLLAEHGVGNAASVAPLSQYGQIQNVQNYSSNPLWNKNGPYNQTFPQPVYVGGPDLNSGDCQRTVFALVSSFCAINDNCYGMQLKDIRPNIMLQLSRLPGHNWATQCVGYIDDAFNKYEQTVQNHVPVQVVKFPDNGIPSTLEQTEFKIENPFAPQIPDWAQEMKDRKQELKQLQAMH